MAAPVPPRQKNALPFARITESRLQIEESTHLEPRERPEPASLGQAPEGRFALQGSTSRVSPWAMEARIISPVRVFLLAALCVEIGCVWSHEPGRSGPSIGPEISITPLVARVARSRAQIESELSSYGQRLDEAANCPAPCSSSQVCFNMAFSPGAECHYPCARQSDCPVRQSCTCGPAGSCEGGADDFTPWMCVEF